jgi:hypothetical protein
MFKTIQNTYVISNDVVMPMSVAVPLHNFLLYYILNAILFEAFCLA